MTVRAKLKLTCIKTEEFTKDYPKTTTVQFRCQYDDSIPDDQRFAKATPCGYLELQVDNPAALEQFVAGKDYYIDIVPAS